MHYFAKLFSFLIVALIATVAGANAADPSFRYCEAGYLDRDNASEVVFSQAMTGGVGGRHASNRSDQDGFAGNCVIDFSFAPVSFFRPFLFAEFDRYTQDLSITSGYSSSCGLYAPPSTFCLFVLTGASGAQRVRVNQMRFGLGASRSLPSGLAAYWQLGGSIVDLNSGIDVVTMGNGFIVESYPLYGETGGFDDIKLTGEVGLKWRAHDRVELAAFGRYDGAGIVEQRVVTAPGLIGADPAASVASVGSELADDFRGGGALAFNLAGPAWISARYEKGKADRLFVGARIAF